MVRAGENYVFKHVLPAEELPSVITLSFPIGLPMQGGPIPFFMPLALLGKYKHYE